MTAFYFMPKMTTCLIACFALIALIFWGSCTRNAACQRHDDVSKDNNNVTSDFSIITPPSIDGHERANRTYTTPADDLLLLLLPERHRRRGFSRPNIISGGNKHVIKSPVATFPSSSTSALYRNGGAAISSKTQPDSVVIYADIINKAIRRSIGNNNFAENLNNIKNSKNEADSVLNLAHQSSSGLRLRAPIVSVTRSGNDYIIYAENIIDSKSDNFISKLILIIRPIRVD